MADYPNPPKSDAEYTNEAHMKLLGREPLIDYLRREFAPQPVSDDADPTAPDDIAERDLSVLIAEGRAAVDAPIKPMSEYEFLHGAPHPAAVEHMQHAIDRVKPPSLVRMDRGEAALAAVVAWRNLELNGQEVGDHQWNDALDYARTKIDRYIEAES